LPLYHCRLVCLLFTDSCRRKRLLEWVIRKVRVHTEVYDFCTSWQDGTVLCALLEAICPGVCPSYHLLSRLNRVKNCRLGIKLAHKYLYVPTVRLIYSERNTKINSLTTIHKLINSPAAANTSLHKLRVYDANVSRNCLDTSREHIVINVLIFESLTQFILIW